MLQRFTPRSDLCKRRGAPLSPEPPGFSVSVFSFLTFRFCWIVSWKKWYKRNPVVVFYFRPNLLCRRPESVCLCLQHGEQWQKDDCTTCVCEGGQSKCHTHTCQPVVCDKVSHLTHLTQMNECRDSTVFLLLSLWWADTLGSFHVEGNWIY